MKNLMKLAAVVLFGLCSCQQGDTTKEAKEANIELVAGTEKDTARVNISMPIYANEQVNKAILEQVSETLDGTYKGDYADVDSFARHWLRINMEEMAEMHSEDEDTWSEDMEFMMRYERELNITKIYETELLVTLNIQIYIYSGGAHGSTIDYGMTFRKSDGRLMGKNMFNTLEGDEGWRDMMYHGLMEYFEVKTEEELSECLFEPELYKLNLPEAEPYFTEEGLSFIYQQYEIAAYAYGMPSFTIPYDKVKKYLNVTGLRLLGEED